jgi:general stress protein YciG
MSWTGDKSRTGMTHAKAGAMGGKKQGKHNNPANFANDPKKAQEAGKKSKRKVKYSFDTNSH